MFVAGVAAAIYVLLPHKLVFAFRGQTLLAASDHEGIAPRPQPPVHLPATPPPGFALPEKRGGLLGGNR
jgi:hypothetical protein